MVLSHFKVSFREKTCIYKMDTPTDRESRTSHLIMLMMGLSLR